MSDFQAPFHQPRPLQQLVRMSLSLAVLALTASGCSIIQNSSRSDAIASQSDVAKLALAQHLTNSGAKMYGTYWCPYCTQQKELFGQAIEEAPVIECDPKGPNAQPALCASANVSGYPTWEIQGQQYRGVHSLKELAGLSHYQGPTNFDDSE